MHVHVVMSPYVHCLSSLIKKGMLVILNNDNYVDMHTKLQVNDSICWLKITQQTIHIHAHQKYLLTHI